MIDKDDELAQRVSMLFYGNHPTVHCNRLPGWAQLSGDEQAQWRSTAFHIERLMREAVLAEREQREQAQQYAAQLLSDISDLKAENSTLRDCVVTYGDKVRMANAANTAMQQAIDLAFDREQ